MGEAFITRRGGGGGAPTTKTAITNQMVYDSSISGMVCDIDPNKMYLAVVEYKTQDGYSYEFWATSVISGGVLLFDGGVSWEPAQVSVSAGKLIYYARDTDGFTLYELS